MLTMRQVLILSGVAVLFWIAAAAFIHFLPTMLVDPLQGSTGFLTSIPVCWLCVRFGRWVASLSAAQLVPGTALTVAVAALMDGSALRWAHWFYADNDTVCRLGAAWLLWGYGVSLGIALLMQRRMATTSRARPAFPV